nr:reverse transcriptase domain-containing protein [Tanacetum cinerariifolium]
MMDLKFHLRLLFSKVVENEPEASKDTVHPTNNESSEDVQPLVVLTQSLTLNSKPVNSPTIEPVAFLVSAPRPNLRPLIPYPSRLQDQKLRDKANDQRKKFFQIFKDLNFNISFADALILMPKFGPSINSLLTNKDKLFFDGPFGGVGDEEVIVGEGVVVTSSSLEILTNSCLGRIMVSLIFLEGLVEKALEEFMVESFEDDDKMSKKYGLFNLRA